MKLSTYGPGGTILLVGMARADILTAPSALAPDLLPKNYYKHSFALKEI